MTKANYDLVILSHTSCKSIESLVQELLIILDKVGDPYLEYKLSEALLFEQNSSAILDNISQAEGETYQDKFRELDVETELRPTLQLVARETTDTDEELEKYTCPACQHVQPKQKAADAMNTCESCGVVGEKLKKNERREEVFQLEKRKLEQTQNRQMQDAFERAQHDEEETMRDEARQKLGLKSKSKYGPVFAGLGIIAVVSTTAYFITDKIKQETNTTTEQTTEANIENAPQDELTNQTTAKHDIASTTEQEASEKTTETTPQQPMVTIQGGNGTIVVNNDSQDTGKGGSKGTTTGEAATVQNATSVATTANNQPQTSGSENAATIAAATANNTNSSETSTQRQATQQTSAEASTGKNNTQQQTNTQLAALSSTQENATIAQATATASTNALSAATAAQKPKILEGVSAPAKDIQQLKNILQLKYEQPKQFFSRLNPQQFTEHQQRLRRLLALDKPDLALIFAEGIEDPYLASLLILEVAKYGEKKSNLELNDAMLMGMKAQVAKSNSVANTAILNASLSQAYDFVGDQVSAREVLKQSVQMLNHKDISVAQNCKLLTQIDQNHRRFGNQNGADFMAGTLIEFANKLPAKDYRYRSEIYTHLAATALRDGKQEDATEWLKHIPVQNTQRELLSELETILVKTRFNKAD